MSKVNYCPICAGTLEEVADLPQFPLCGRYEPWTDEFEDRGRFDQKLLYCEPCGHGMMANVIDPALLYGEGYTHRTGFSLTSATALWRFLSFMLQHFYPRNFLTLIDIGGSDGLLGRLLPELKSVEVDPAAKGQFACTFAEADLSAYKNEAKIIASSHTLEHIEDVNAFMAKVDSLWREGDVLALSVPSFDVMLAERRFDQLTHEHIHHFSLRSLGLLLAKHGFGIVKHEINHMHWGSLMVICDRKVRGVEVKYPGPAYKIGRARYFFNARLVDLLLPDAIGFGAGPMTPVLRYFMPQLEDLEYLCDNDANKNGMRYINWNKRITSDFDLRDRNVVITAPQSRLAMRSMISQAFNAGARNVTVPVANL